jgi:SAM-dependent methyltransferase
MLVMASELGLEGTPASDSIPRVLAQEYFSKPMHALARSYDLAAHNLVKLDIRRPALDLGCGNGGFGSVFCSVNGLNGFDFGMDLDIRSVRLARRRGLYKIIFRSDVRTLPIKTETIEFILCSGVLCSIHPRYDLALLEIARILKSGGQLVLTLPTPGYTSALLPTRLFECLGLRKLAVLYSKQVNERNQHHKLEYLEWWQKELERAGLKIEEYVHYFAASEAAWWSILNMRPFQLFAVSRYLPGFIQRIAADFTERVTRAVPRSIQPSEQECGYLLISARKP